MTLRRELHSSYLWLKQFWPWHKRSAYIARWSARHLLVADFSHFFTDLAVGLVGSQSCEPKYTTSAVMMSMRQAKLNGEW